MFFVCFMVEFFGVCVFDVCGVVCGFDDGYLYVQVDVKIWDFMFLCELCGFDFVFGVMFVKVVRD